MSKYELAHVLSLIRHFLDDLAIVLEQMVDKELIEFLLRTLLFFIDLSG